MKVTIDVITGQVFAVSPYNDLLPSLASGDDARQKLISEREALVARLAEIDAELAGSEQ